MEQIEKRKNLEKKKAYFTCLMLFLILLIPCLFTFARSSEWTSKTLTIVVSQILLLGVIVLLRLRRIRAILKKI